MSDKIDRRGFIKQGTTIVGGTLLVGSGTLGCKSKDEPEPKDEKPSTPKPEAKPAEPSKPAPDVSVVTGDDFGAATLKAVDQLGGMEKFVPKGSKVAVLANPQRNNPGAFTSPKVLESVVRQCLSAGAASVTCISWLPDGNWESTGLRDAAIGAGAILDISDHKDETLFKKVAIEKGKALKEAEIMKSFYESDLLINVPVTKDHAGNKFTGTLKNLMGLNSPKSDRTFHKEDWDTNPESIQFLDQCIADLNLAVKPALCVVDATEFIVTNGPFGPGKLHAPKKVVAGVDRVAIDSYCCTLWGLKPEEIYTIKAAAAHGLGEMDLSKVVVQEAKV